MMEFEIRVAGPVPADVLEELRDVRVAAESVDTVLRGPVRDQAELVGIINRLQDWGIELRAVRQLAPGDAASPREEPTVGCRPRDDLRDKGSHDVGLVRSTEGHTPSSC
jgi:hypothetical protein